MQVSILIKAPRSAVYEACLDADAIVRWRVPDNMIGQVDTFDPREAGIYRMSLAYRGPAGSPRGKSGDSVDCFQGRFVELIPDRKIVEAIEFVSEDTKFSGEMTITTTLTEDDDQTEMTMLFEGIPSGIRLEDNEAGSKQSLRKLAALFD